MGAVTGVVLTMLPPGGTLALAEGSYYGHKLLFDHLAPWGVNAVEYDQTGPPPANADLILIEAPANPMLTMPDFESAAAQPRRSSAMPPWPRRSASARSTSDATSRCTAPRRYSPATTICSRESSASRTPISTRRLDRTRQLAGIVASADTAWLVERGLQTLEVRLERMEASARILAGRLCEHAAVATVRYPGFGFVLSFDVADGAAARRVETATETITNATSLGSTHTKLESRHRWEGARCPEGLLRLSVGLEDGEILWADLEQALARA